MKIASKTFLLGEYAILQGAGLVLAHEPYFSFTSGTTTIFHPHSLAGKFLAEGNGALVHPYFSDPYLGLGGFGGSGAEFVGVYAQICGVEKGSVEFAWRAWEKSRELGELGSGADILAQSYSLGRASCLLAIDIERHAVAAVPSLGLNVQIFHTQKKSNTHDLLAAKPKIPDSLRVLARAGVQAALAADRAAFLRINKEYAGALRDLNLLAPHSAAALDGLPAGVQGRACGAMGSDVVVVFSQDSMREWAHKYQLKYISEVLI